MGRIEFTDQVMAFGTHEGRLNVLFARQAAEYRIPPRRDDFAQLVAKLASAWSRQATARFAVEGTEIVAIEPVED